MVTDLRCSSCNAPIDLAQSRLQTCKFCGAALVVKEMAPARGTEVVTQAVVLMQCGPSNVARVTKLLVKHGVKDADAASFMAHLPCDVVQWEERSKAEILQRALEEAGARARVERRVVVVPPPAQVRVVLDEVGSDKVAVMRAVREFVELGMAESKALVAKAPCTLADAIEEPKARALCAALLAAGARARMI